MFTKASIVTLFASIAAAQLHAPVGEPKGNAILRPLNEVVPACKPFTIVWEPTTTNTVSVLLLKGPATNVVKFGPSLAEGIANSGSLTFTPASTLEGTAGPMGYGIQIIDDVTGQYQYSTQFGISKDACAAVSSAAPVASSVAPVASSAAPVASSQAPGYPVGSSSSALPATNSPVPYPTAPAATAPYPTKASSTLVANPSGVQPTGSMYVKPSSTGNMTSPTLPESTGAASALQAGLSFAGAAVAMALML